MAVRHGDLGLRGRGSGRCEPLGTWAGACPVRPASHFADLVARSSGRDQGRHDLRAGDAARQALPLWRAHRGNADRSQGFDRDRLQLPGQADHRRRSFPRLWRSRDITMTISLSSRLVPADRFIVPLDAPAATDAARVGPKAANLAALARAGLPTPGGFCLAADAYDAQIAALGLGEALAQFAAADLREQRRLSVEIRLALYEQPIVPEILEPLRDAWRAQRAACGKPCAVRSSALIEDRKGANFAGQFESFLGIDDEAAFLTAVRA